MIFPLKKITREPRPDASSFDSFPSGHTAEAFMAATFLHKEYGKDHPWLSVAAYTTATGVGVLRVMNNRHWVSDVLVGAGIGVFSTNLAYLTHQYRWGKHKKKLQASIVPTFGQGVTGMYIAIPVR
jgi:membrane-associated phospholipid phosphatase